MSPIVALAICLCFVFALFVIDQRWRPKTSIGGWIPLIWLLIIGSRPVSSWFTLSLPMEGAEDYAEGSPADRAFYEIMIFAGLLVLFFRGISWPRFIIKNKLLVLYFAYFGISVLWSDQTFVAFKRWIKDVGNVVMVLIVLSERNPTAAIEALLVRCSYVLVPLSVLLVKYFPDFGRAYNRWTGLAYYSGVAQNKNLLGMALTVLGISLLWGLMQLIDGGVRRNKKLQAFVYLVLLAMTVTLLVLADSVTAIICTSLATIVLLILRYRNVRHRIATWVKMGIFASVVLVSLCIFGYLVLASLLLVPLGTSWDAGAPLLQALGRDPSLTGRTDIWNAILKEDINPLFGVGFYSFWLGDRAERISAGFYYVINEAHNGYLEIYLNGGFIGLTLFLMMLLSTAKKSLAGLAKGHEAEFHSIQLAFVAIAIIYNFSEAVVSRLDLVWFSLLLVMTVYPRRDGMAANRGTSSQLTKVHMNGSSAVGRSRLRAGKWRLLAVERRSSR